MARKCTVVLADKARKTCFSRYVTRSIVGGPIRARQRFCLSRGVKENAVNSNTELDPIRATSSTGALLRIRSETFGNRLNFTLPLLLDSNTDSLVCLQHTLTIIIISFSNFTLYNVPIKFLHILHFRFIKIRNIFHFLPKHLKRVRNRTLYSQSTFVQNRQ